MIPVQPFSFFAIFLLFFVPLIGVVLTLGLLVKLIFFWRKKAQKPVRFFSRKTLFITLLALICDLWAGYLFYMIASVKYEFALKQHYKESRSHFVLSQDAQYGELLIPKGSLISRYDAFDNGEPQLPLGLRGLQAVRFPHPVQVAGMWVTAMEPPRMELAWDQHVGPVMRFDPNEENRVMVNGFTIRSVPPSPVLVETSCYLKFHPFIMILQKNLVNLNPMELMHVFVRVSGVFKNVKKVKGQLKLVQHIWELSPKSLGFNLTEKLY